MTDAPNEIVDERYWLARAAEIVSTSSTNLDQGAQRIASAMAWFWTVYSGGVVATLAFLQQSITLNYALLIASPVVTLFIAYGLSTWASLPVPVSFNVVNPNQIKDAFESAILAKRVRLRISLFFAGLTTLLVACVAIAIAVKQPAHSERIAIQLSNTNGEPEIIIGGSAPEKSDLLIVIAPKGHAENKVLLTVDENHYFSHTIPVPSSESYNVQISWHANNRSVLLKEVIKRDDGGHD